ncbi:chorismate synthase [Buchananella felis]|uniref:chorismate synthase n=1 Tax=Buchananella felis TaxID=3231492 RepID=UPI003529CF63
MQWTTAGESHGPSLVGILDGIPAGIEITTEQLRTALARRRLGYGRGARMKFEQDEVRILGGVRHGRTLGGPVAIEIKNSEWPKWQTVMSADPVDPAELLIDAGTGDEREVSRNRRLTRPRPGHADLTGMRKYNHCDARHVLERASARETAARVALGEVAAAALRQIAGVELVSHVTAIGQASLPADAPRPAAGATPELDASPVRCLDDAAAAAMIAEIDAAKAAGDTLGGVVEVIAYGVPAGLGSFVRASSKLDARLAAAIMGIQAIKGVEIGDGFLTAARPGSRAHDEIVPGEAGQPGAARGSVAASVVRLTNRAGGIEGGMSNGEPIVVRAAMKPISTVPRALRTVDVATGEAATALHQRSDTCAVPPAAVVAEAMVALTLLEALLEKTGGDSVVEAKRNLEAYLAHDPWEDL